MENSSETKVGTAKHSRKNHLFDESLANKYVIFIRIDVVFFVTGRMGPEKLRHCEQPSHAL